MTFLYQLLAILTLGAVVVAAIQNGGQTVTMGFAGLVAPTTMNLSFVLLLMAAGGGLVSYCWQQVALAKLAKTNKQTVRGQEKADLALQDAQRENATLKQKITTLEAALDKQLAQPNSAVE